MPRRRREGEAPAEPQPAAGSAEMSHGKPLPVADQSARFAAAPPMLDGQVVGFVSLGCAKNLVDSEKMLGQIAEAGAIISGDESAADTIVVNTCGFLGASRDEAMEIIAELAERKRRGDLKRIVVAGCLVQRDGKELLSEIPEIDALVGVNNRDDVVAAVFSGEASKPHRKKSRPTSSLYLGEYHTSSAGKWTDQGRLRLTPAHYAYVRISEGCNQKCTFCTIPSIRGPMHCKTPEAIEAECQELIADGARELILIGQDTTSYGEDIGYEPGLAGLLRKLDAECDGAHWIRLMYVYPSILTDAMIDAIAECERVVNYIDIPLQHINDRVLRSMHRRVTRKQTEALLGRLRERIPSVTIRTTFIVGFPGETDAEFGELRNFVGDFGFDAVGAFRYSNEPDTPAGRMKEQVSANLVDERYERLMLAQQEQAIAAARRWIGQQFAVLVDGPLPVATRAVKDAASTDWVARHAGQAPEVDSVCLLRGKRNEPGSIIRAECTASDGYDLIIKPIRSQ